LTEIKVKLNLCLIKNHTIEDIFQSLIKYHTTKTYGRMETELHTFLSSAIDGGELSASHLGNFTPGKQHSISAGQRRMGP